jgi:hypothetical protein
MAHNTRKTNPPQQSVTAKKTSTPKSHSSWVARVNAGLKLRAGAEREIAAALAEHKKKVGTKRWLADCEREWSWSSSTAYRHLDPKQMEAARVHTCEQRIQIIDRPGVPTVGTIPTTFAGRPSTSQQPCVECGQVSSGSFYLAHAAGCSKETAAQKIARAQDEARQSEQRRFAALGVAQAPGRIEFSSSNGNAQRKPRCKECKLSSHHRLECSQYDHAARLERIRLTTNGASLAQQQEQREKDEKDDRGHRTEQLTENIQELVSLVIEIEGSQTLLTPRYVEMLATAWDKIGAMIERHGHDGAIVNGEPESNAGAGALL